MKKLFVLVCVLSAVFLAGCSTSSTQNRATSIPVTTSPGIQAPAPAPAPGISFGSGSGGKVGTPGLPETTTQTPPADLSHGVGTATDPMIVRTGNMALVVDDVNIAITQITNMAAGFTGYVISSNVYQNRETLNGNISIRVPVDKFDAAISGLRALAVDVTSETTNSQDVTQEYVDLGAQLKNLQATEQQLLVLMQKAGTVTEILAVQNQLTIVQGQIEQLKARMQYLQQTSSSSRIDVSLQQSKISLDFNANKTVVKAGELTYFNPDISGGFAPYSYTWDFGDKTTSTESGLYHAYKNAGKYTVNLTVTDDHGNKVTKTRTDYITVLAGWSAGNVASSAWSGMVAFGHALVSFFIWLAIFSPVWIIVGGIIWWVVRKSGKTH